MQCTNCRRIFSSGINLGIGATVTLKSNVSQCPFCGSMESIPDGTFRATVEGFIEILEGFENPLSKAKELLSALEKSKSVDDLAEIKKSSKFSKFEKWIPNTPGKIATYITIISIVIQLLTQKPGIHIEYNNFINQYNQVINIDLDNK